MREAAFVKQNQKRWKEFEQALTSGKPVEPDRLAEIFIQLTDDLSFARTQYPESRATQYLNNLASKIHLEIYKNKKENTNRFIVFWKQEVPALIYQSRKVLLYSLLIFITSCLMGVVSTLYDDTFVRLILGDGYVNMTLENIKNGKPTGVYADENAFDMFWGITFNNIMVSFWMFILGVFTSIMTSFMIFRNGIMVGAFVTMFYKESLLSHAFPVIMLHGTIELSSLVIAGAAGMIMGNSWLFPGTYSRLESFKRGAFTGLKIILGLTPFIVMAGFIESFITRYEFMHWGLKALVIGVSAFIMIYYFVIYPVKLHRHGRHSDH